MSLIESSATDLRARLESGELTSVELTQACLAQIETHEPRIRAFLRVDAEGALRQAAESDRRRQQGDSRGPLDGLPVAVKDVLCTKGQVTTCGSQMLASFAPPYDATVISRLESAGAVLLGKTNMDEFAMGSSTENSSFYATRNPWDVARTPGGSSGGAAACVAARMVPLSIGSDTGGSIRQPAAFCGVIGLKPTYGRVSRFGLVAFASSLDQVGPLARTVADVALLAEVIAGYDPRDSTSADLPVPSYGDHLHQPLDGLRIGLVREHFSEGLDGQIAEAVREAARVWQSQGAAVREISLPHSKYAIATYYIIAPSEASSNLARYDGVHYGYRTDEQQLVADRAADAHQAETSSLVRMYCRTRAEGFGPEVKRRIMLGTYALSAGYYDAYYLKALKVRRLIRQDFDAAFQDVDLILGPTTPSAAYPLGEKVDDPLAMYLGDLYTASANLAGIPAISLPGGMTSDGLPIGLQLQAPPFAEPLLLRAASLYQQATDWHTRRPELD